LQASVHGANSGGQRDRAKHTHEYHHDEAPTVERFRRFWYAHDLEVVADTGGDLYKPSFVLGEYVHTLFGLVSVTFRKGRYAYLFVRFGLEPSFCLECVV